MFSVLLGQREPLQLYGVVDPDPIFLALLIRIYGWKIASVFPKKMDPDRHFREISILKFFFIIQTVMGVQIKYSSTRLPIDIMAPFI